MSVERERDDRLYSGVMDFVRSLRNHERYNRLAAEAYTHVLHNRQRGLIVREVAEDVAKHWDVGAQELIDATATLMGDISGLKDVAAAKEAMIEEKKERLAEREAASQKAISP